MKLSWTRAALNKLIEIEEFIARDNPRRAEDFIDYLIERTSLISKNPEVGRIVPEIANITTRELLIRNYRVVHKVKVGAVDILTVFEGHKLPRRDEILDDPK